MRGDRTASADDRSQQTTAMDVREREIIRRNHRLLIQNIILTEEFFDHLKNYHVLPDTMIKDIKVCCSISVRFGLLAIDCDWGAYVKLLVALGFHQILYWISLYKKNLTYGDRKSVV